MHLEVAKDPDLSVEAGGEDAGERRAQPIPSEQDQEHHDREHDQAADHRADVSTRAALPGGWAIDLGDGQGDPSSGFRTA